MSGKISFALTVGGAVLFLIGSCLLLCVEEESLALFIPVALGVVLFSVGEFFRNR